MSKDRTTEILNYLSAISREVGALRAEVKALDTRLERIEQLSAEQNTRLERIEREQKRQGRRIERIEGFAQTMRADIEDLQDRVTELEEAKQA